MRIRERFNPRAPCGARPLCAEPFGLEPLISTHAPLAGRDIDGFLSQSVRQDISTHAPLAGRDRHHMVDVKGDTK